MFTVTQAGAAPICSYSLSPTSASVPAAGGSASFIGDGSRQLFVDRRHLSGLITNLGGSGSGNGTVSLTVTANSSTVVRTGTVTVQGQIFTVFQAGAEATCSYSVSPTSATVPADGRVSASFAVTAGSGCAWTAATAQSWVAHRRQPAAPAGGHGVGGRGRRTRATALAQRDRVTVQGRDLQRHPGSRRAHLQL